APSGLDNGLRDARHGGGSHSFPSSRSTTQQPRTCGPGPRKGALPCSPSPLRVLRRRGPPLLFHAGLCLVEHGPQQIARLLLGEPPAAPWRAWKEHDGVALRQPLHMPCCAVGAFEPLWPAGEVGGLVLQVPVLSQCKARAVLPAILIRSF